MTSVVREVWHIEWFSREAGRGTLSHPDGRRLGFDAAVALVDAFTNGEAVNVEIDMRAPGPCVRRVEPVQRSSPPSKMSPELVVAPTGYLALRCSAEEREALEDLECERLVLTSPMSRPNPSSKYRGSYVLDEGPALRALVEERAGGPVDDLVQVSGTYPFEWKGLGLLDPLFERIFRQLPGHHAGTAAFFGASAAAGGVDEPSPPYLDCSIEPHGLLVHGVLAEGQWQSWRIAFERLTRHLPLRDAW